MPGADKAIHIPVADDAVVQPLAVAKLLQKVVEREYVLLVTPLSLLLSDVD